MAAKGKRRANNEGWFNKDGDLYRVRLPVGVDPATGKVRYRSARVKSHAEGIERLQEMRAELRQGKLVPSTKGNLASYLHAWLENHIKPTRSASTYRQYTWLVNQHIIPVLGKKRVEDVKRADVKALLAAKATQSVSPRSAGGAKTGRNLSWNTQRLIKAALHSAFSDAIQDGLIVVNPASNIELGKKQKQPPVFLRPQEAIQLLQEAEKTPLAAFWRFMITTGCRLAEASGVRWSDVDLGQGLVVIQGQLQRIDGALTYVKGTKTNQVRTIALSPSLVDKLRDLKTGQMFDGVQDPEGIVFLNPEGRRLDPKYVNNQLKRTCEAAGVKVISAHKLRHTAATLALAETGDLQGVKQMLGHSQVALTADLYGHALTEPQRRLSSALDRVLGSEN
ncbi:MAG: tyrosine-type recombinase/integrase [Fimbriimonadaceae bacterium]|nr:tyrosine-type recombinase/integrase [Fimbriimonadaceae bacterium]